MRVCTAAVRTGDLGGGAKLMAENPCWSSEMDWPSALLGQSSSGTFLASGAQELEGDVTGWALEESEAEAAAGRNLENSEMRSGWPAKRILTWALAMSTERCSI